MDTLTSYSASQPDFVFLVPDSHAEESVVAFDTAPLPLELKGEKASVLEFLTESGLPVPAWFLALPEALLSGTRRVQAEEFLQARDATKAKFFAQRCILSPRASEEIAGAVNQLMHPAGERGSEREAYFAVRVSFSPSEAASRLNDVEPLFYLRPDDIPGALLRVWHSVYSEEALYKRLAANLPLVMYPPALIVQRMTRADVSGLAYGGDPLTGRRGTTVVAAVYGLGTSIVSGESDADTYEITRERVVTRRDIACKQVAHVLDVEEGFGVSARLIPISQQELPLLTDAQVAALSDLTRRVGALYHRPQEVEWAMEAGRIAVLGSRVAPALPRLSDPDAPVSHWHRETLASLYPGVLATLTYTLAKAMLSGQYLQLHRVAGSADSERRPQGRLLARLVGQVDGAVYINADAARQMVEELPQPEWQRAQLAASLGIDSASGPRTLSENPSVVGGEESFSSDGVEVIHLDVLGNSRIFSALQAQSARHDIMHRGFSDRLKQVLSGLESPLPLSQLRLDELVGHIHDVQQQLVDNWDAPASNQMLVAALTGLLGQLTSAWCEDHQGEMRRDLLLNVGDLPGSAAGRLIRRIAAGVSASNLTELFQNEFEASIRGLLAKDAHASIRMEIEEYLNEWGDVIPDGLKLEARTLRENSLPLLRHIGMVAASGFEVITPRSLLPTICVTADNAEAAKSARARAERYFSDRTMRRRYFDKVYALARQHARCQELYEFDKVRVFAALRALLIEIGRRLYAINALETPMQIVHLELDEVIGFAEGSASCTDLKGLARVRNAQYSGWVENAATRPAAERVSLSLPVSAIAPGKAAV